MKPAIYSVVAFLALLAVFIVAWFVLAPQEHLSRFASIVIGVLMGIVAGLIGAIASEE